MSTDLRKIKEYKILKIIDHNSTIRELILEALNEEGLNFKAGQFLMLQLPQSTSSVAKSGPESRVAAGSESRAESGPDSRVAAGGCESRSVTNKPIQRAYSIASSDQNKRQIHLILKYKAFGRASLFVWGLKGDEILRFTGPFGRTVLPIFPPKEVVFLCTSTGLAQPFSILSSQGESRQDMSWKLYIGVRREEDLFYQKELEVLQQKLQGRLEYHYVLSRPSPRWSGLTGYVQDYLSPLVMRSKTKTETETLESISDEKRILFFLCGNGEMIHAAKSILLDEHKIEKSQVLFESFD